jgi:hypothetical protein
MWNSRSIRKIIERQASLQISLATIGMQALLLSEVTQCCCSCEMTLLVADELLALRLVFCLLPDNGKEFIAVIVTQLLMEMNPHCAIINGRPRTPRDQGSVENMNKLVQQVLKAICCENWHMIGGEVNWTKLLGRVMSVCNSHSNCRSSSVSVYEAVFGQKYHPQLKCTVSELRKCRTISQRLMVSPDDRLEAYVREHDIVDIAQPSDENKLVSTDESDDENEEEGLEIDEHAFPELDDDDSEVPIYDNFYPDDDDGAPVTSLTPSQELAALADGAPVTSFSPSQELAALADGAPVTSFLPSLELAAMADGDDGDDESADSSEDKEMDCATVGVTPIDSLVGATVCRLTYDSPPGSPPPNDVNGDAVVEAVVDTSEDPDHNRTSLVQRGSVATMLTIPQAWECGTVAQLERSLSDRRAYKFLLPRLECRHCCFQK